MSHLVAHRGVEPSLSRMKILSHQTDRRMRHTFLTNLVAGVGLEPHDLQVMGLVSYLCSTPQFYIKTENVFDYLIP